ncbi:Panacea domain-containing protein [Salinibacillus xinjiangensis]|uniref:DUF4065 domain-containing protein n=1 Tax=Salinibacillus xinjiangensis TaxID=1229268 RepID=A0A6G1X7D5_9BACI|nr:type II toxin-antitoxin system antitoxin SocA domain-containing protein [Salinibacillus xinjiangensis]MRG86718.1 DUF4065 domain-containing protein [Salinibacillus xinjiangensis]
MTMRQFADHVIAVSNTNASGISNLELQKVMYFALGEYIKEHGLNDTVFEIYTEPFQAWPYGPVIKTEYFRHKKYGRYSIRDDGEYNPAYSEFDELIRKNLRKSVSQLVEESHNHATWLNNKQSILQNIPVRYTLEDLNRDFTD